MSQGQKGTSVYAYLTVLILMRKSVPSVTLDPSTHGNPDAGVEGVAVVGAGVAGVQMPMVPLFLVMITIVLMRMVPGYQVVQVQGVGVEVVVGVETMVYIGMITTTLIYPKLPLEVPPLEGVDALTRTVLSYLAKMAWMMVWKWQPLGNDSYSCVETKILRQVYPTKGNSKIGLELEFHVELSSYFGITSLTL